MIVSIVCICVNFCICVCVCIYAYYSLYFRDLFYSYPVPSDGSPLNKDWIQKRLEATTLEKMKLTTDKKMLNNKVLKNKVSN